MTATEYVAGLRRRREASRRLPVLPCGHADPWRYDAPGPSERYVDGYRDAAQHLLAVGMTPASNVDAMRAMWRRGGTDQRLAAELAERWEVAV